MGWKPRCILGALTDKANKTYFKRPHTKPTRPIFNTLTQSQKQTMLALTCCWDGTFKPTWASVLPSNIQEMHKEIQ